MIDQSNALTPAIDWGTLEKVIVQGDIANLNSAERLNYYRAVCTSVGLNPATQPFAYIRLNNKLTLYARKDATDQLRRLYRVSIGRLEKERDGDLFTVTAYATMPDGREDADMGAVNVKGLSGEALANAYLKAITKAKRRVTLSICGLGMLDETEVDSIPNAVHVKDGEVVYTPPIDEPTHRMVAIPSPVGGPLGKLNLDDAEAVWKHLKAHTTYSTMDLRGWLSFHDKVGLTELTEAEADELKRDAIANRRPWQTTKAAEQESIQDTSYNQEPPTELPGDLIGDDFDAEDEGGAA